MAHEPNGGGPPQPDPSGDPAAMLSSLQTTHQLADSKAGVLAGVQAALIVSFGTWARSAREAWAHEGFGAVSLDALVALFVVAFLSGVTCLALVLRPRLWLPASFNRYSVHVLASTMAVPRDATGEDPAARARAEMWEACRFLATVTVTKCRYVTAAVLCTAVMAAAAGVSLLLRAFLR
jgi:hypothetical protein